jgi:hypothetical protein
MREVMTSRDWNLAEGGTDSAFADSYAVLFNLLLQFKIYIFSSACNINISFQQVSVLAYAINKTNENEVIGMKMCDF